MEAISRVFSWSPSSPTPDIYHCHNALPRSTKKYKWLELSLWSIALVLSRLVYGFPVHSSALPVVITPAVDHRHNWGHLALVGRVITFVRSLFGSFLWSYISWKYIGLRPKTASNFYAWIFLTFLSWKVFSLKHSIQLKERKSVDFLMIFASLSTLFTGLSIISIWLEKTYFIWLEPQSLKP